jgi:hypothetical protein
VLDVVVPQLCTLADPFHMTSRREGMRIGNSPRDLACVTSFQVHQHCNVPN